MLLFGFFIYHFHETTSPNFRSAFAANDIYLQQYQLQRFLTEHWRAPVAVNDIGLTSYRNDHFVLDLWGLGSEEARKERSKPGWPGSLVDRHKVGLAMIYDSWFHSRIPAEWIKVAELHLGRKRVIVSSETYAFYLTPHGDCGKLVGALEAFAPTLPKGPYLTMLATC